MEDTNNISEWLCWMLHDDVVDDCLLRCWCVCLWLEHKRGKSLSKVGPGGDCSFESCSVMCRVVERVTLLAVDIVSLCSASGSMEACGECASWMCAFTGGSWFDKCRRVVGGCWFGECGSKSVCFKNSGCKRGAWWEGDACSCRWWWKVECYFSLLVIDDGLDDVLDVASALQECNGDDIPCLLI